jgi:hypothetical protein
VKDKFGWSPIKSPKQTENKDGTIDMGSKGGGGK